eukprot:TRINITY_DN5446_c0_g2_i3.p1 TRINITY_DN5446_c0_g2~~TRINITY_DN5446_c0_g2_i3.p1  ORF type:complete len:1553 (+),score=475.01 TRINITY_DN5446_c0_g2_i3:123-4781(+)
MRSHLSLLFLISCCFIVRSSSQCVANATDFGNDVSLAFESVQSCDEIEIIVGEIFFASSAMEGRGKRMKLSPNSTMEFSSLRSAITFQQFHSIDVDRIHCVGFDGLSMVFEDCENALVRNGNFDLFGGIISTYSNLTVQSCFFTNQALKRSIDSSYHQLTIIDSIFTDNQYRAIEYRKGYFIDSFRVINCNFRNNRHNFEGGVIYSDGSVFVQNSIFFNSYAHSSGGTISAINTTIEASTFTGGTAEFGWGGAIYSTFVKVSDSNLEFNTAQQGGAIYAEFVESKNTTYFGNIGRLGDGGGIHLVSYNDVPPPPSSFEGDTFNSNQAIQNGGGIYSELAISVRKSTFILNSSGNQGAAITIVDFKSDFTFEDSRCFKNVADGWGGGCIYLSSIGPMAHIRRSTFDSNKGYAGGAIRSSASSVNVTDCEFESNSAETFGGSFYSSESQCHLSNVTFSNSNAQEGGAIYVRAFPSVFVPDEWMAKDLVIRDCSAAFSGGGVKLLGLHTTSIFQNTTIFNCAAFNGAGIYASDSSGLELSDFKLYSNAAQRSGGSILIDNTNLTLIRGEIGTSNSIEGGGVYAIGRTEFTTIVNVIETAIRDSSALVQGGGIFLDGYFSSINLTKSQMVNCTAPIHGGGIYSKATVDSFVLFDSGFKNNAAFLYGGFFSTSGKIQSLDLHKVDLENNTSGSGGSIYSSSLIDSLSIRNSTIRKNSAEGRGGGLFLSRAKNIVMQDTIISQNSAAGIGGGIIVSTFDEFTVENCNFFNNTAGQGGAIAYQSLNSLITVTASSFENNQGGGIYMIGSFNFSASSVLFSENESSQGGALYINSQGPGSKIFLREISMRSNTAVLNSGGGMHVEGRYSNITLNQLTVASNEAKSSGGGISLLVNAGTLFVSKCDFSSNRARDVDGGGLAALPNTFVDKLFLVDSTFFNNSAIRGGGVSLPIVSNNLFMNNANLIQNVGVEGGGLFISNSISDVSLRRSTFSRNYAMTNGGGMSLNLNGESRCSIDGCIVDQNFAALGGGAYVKRTASSKKRAALHLLSFSTSSFNRNAANSSGGGLFMDSSSTLSNCNFDNNKAPEGKGTFFASGTSTLENTRYLDDGIQLSDSSSLIYNGDTSFITCTEGKVPVNNGTNVYCQLKSPERLNPVPIIIGATIGGILLVLIIVIFAILYVRARRRKQNGFSMIDLSQINLGEAKSSLIDFDEFKHLKEIGSGAYGVVFKATWRDMDIAVKLIKNDNVTAEQLQEFLREVAIIKRLRPHPHVVLFLGITFPPHPLALATEFCEMGGLYNYLRENEVSDEQKMNFIVGIARGMLHLHHERVIHRDLAVRNILLNKFLEPKVSDFGLSREHQSEESAGVTKSTVGPLKWMPPEAYLHGQYSIKSDAWSFGVTCWEILVVEDPYDDMTNVEAAIAVTTKKLRLAIPSSCNKRLQEVITDCFEEDPNKRPDFAAILLHLGVEKSIEDPIEELPSEDGRPSSPRYPEFSGLVNQQQQSDVPETEVDIEMNEPIYPQLSHIIEGKDANQVMEKTEWNKVNEPSYPEFSQVFKDKNLM